VKERRKLLRLLTSRGIFFQSGEPNMVDMPKNTYIDIWLTCPRANSVLVKLGKKLKFIPRGKGQERKSHKSKRSLRGKE
jgi:hypothetical protein